MATEPTPSGTLLWVGGDAVSRELVEAAALEFRFSPRFCAPDEVLDVVRTVPVELLGLELQPDPRQGLNLIKELHERLPRLTLFAVAADTSVPVMRAALERGASDFLSLPLNRQEIHKALIKFVQLAARQSATGAVGDIITVCGSRGGIGVTTVAVNLATRLRQLTGLEVGLADLDLQRGDVAAFLNLTPMQSIAAISGARGEVDEIFLHGTLTRHSSGVFVLPTPANIEEADSISHDDVKLALRLMRAQFRYVVVDTPRTITGASLAALEDADRILLVTDLSVPGVRGARRMFELLKRLGTPFERVELVVTEAVRGPVDMKEAARTIGKEPFIVIPCDEEAAAIAMNSGVPLNGTRQAGLSFAIGELAAKLGAVVRTGKAPRGHLLRRIFTRETRT